MVNVAGRSKGCSTCRRRRVKCDEIRPVCGRCLRSGLECDGAKDIAFIEGKIVKSRRSQTRTEVSTTFDAGITDSADRQLPLCASLKGNDFEMYLCYTRKNFLRNGVIGLALEGIQLSDIATAGTTTAHGQIFHQAVLSFAVIIFGTQHGQAHIASQGYAMYGEALKQLNQTLSDDPKCYTRDEVILSVVTMVLLECWVPTGPKHHLKHMIGLERLLELRGPGSYSPKSSELYKGVRHMILFASLRTGNPSILAKAEWKTVLRMNCLDEEMQEQELLDVLADCTVFVSERNNVLASLGLDLESGAHQRDELRRRALALLTHLRDWIKRWDSDRRKSADLTSLQRQHSSGDDSPPFPTVFESPSDCAAIMLMFYNTVLIYVLRVLASLTIENLDIFSNQGLIQNTLQDAGDLSDLWKDTKDEYIAGKRLAALEVCRCIPCY